MGTMQLGEQCPASECWPFRSAATLQLANMRMVALAGRVYGCQLRGHGPPASATIRAITRPRRHPR
jgi:hypothetical protein